MHRLSSICCPRGLVASIIRDQPQRCSRRWLLCLVALLVFGSAAWANVNVEFGLNSSPQQSSFYHVTTGATDGVQTISGTFANVDASVCPAGSLTVKMTGGASPTSNTASSIVRDRGGPANSGAFTNGALYESFAGERVGTGIYLWLTISGLVPNGHYSLTLYSYDNSYSGSVSYTDFSSGAAAATGSINYVKAYNFPADPEGNDHFTTTLIVTANSTGIVTIQGTGLNNGNNIAVLNGFELAPLVPVATVGASFADCNLYSDTSLGTPGGAVLNVGESGVDNNNCHVYVPFSASSANVSSIQAAANVTLLMYLRGNSAASYSVDLYGYSNRGSATGAAMGDYSGGTLLAGNVLDGTAQVGWKAFDVTDFVQQQVDAGNTAICFKLQVHQSGLPNGDGHQTNFAFAPADGGPTTAPYLEVTIKHADATSFDNKVVAGYQGWFRCVGDPTNAWSHWCHSGTSLTGTNLNVDFWPDMSLYSAAEKFSTSGMTLPDGTTANLYSADNQRTVLRHFAWMEKYDIDGVFLQKFANYLPGGGHYPSGYTDITQVQTYVQNAAAQTGRVWALEYDCSGTPATTVDSIVENHWQSMVDSGVTNSPGYLHHNGLPVVAVFGFFYNNTNHQLGQTAVANALISYFHNPGKYQAYIVGSGEWNWATDAANDPAWGSMIESLDCYLPWEVGHYTTVSGVSKASTGHWQGDVNLFPGKYLPCVYPGTSNQNETSGAGFTLPRRQGGFLWEQYEAAGAIVKQGTGATINSLFIAMFDEFDEGTGIMPAASVNGIPTQAIRVLNYDEGSAPGTIPSTAYLEWVGDGEYYLKTHQTVPTTIPAPSAP